MEKWPRYFKSLLLQCNHYKVINPKEIWYLAFTTPCTIGTLSIANSLFDHGASINIMSLSIYKQLGLGVPKLKSMKLLMVNHSFKWHLDILYDVLLKVENFIFLVDFVILNCKVEFEVPIILGRPFLATKRVLVDKERNKSNSGSVMKN